MEEFICQCKEQMFPYDNNYWCPKCGRFAEWIENKFGYIWHIPENAKEKNYGV